MKLHRWVTNSKLMCCKQERPLPDLLFELFILGQKKKDVSTITVNFPRGVYLIETACPKQERQLLQNWFLVICPDLKYVSGLYLQNSMEFIFVILQVSLSSQTNVKKKDKYCVLVSELSVLAKKFFMPLFLNHMEFIH